MRLYIVRHGETKRNIERRLSGGEEVPLNERGIRQAIQTRDYLKEVDFDLIISSPSERARNTAEIIADGRDVPFWTDERIHEIDWGDWDGHPNAGDSEEMALEMRLFYHDPLHFHGAPHGETLIDVRERGRDFFRELISKRELYGKNILILTHACAVRGILNLLYENPDDFWQNGVPGNCSVNIVEINHGRGTIVLADKICYDQSLAGNYYTLDD